MKERKMLWGGLAMILVFAVWTAAVCYVDVRAIGPGGSRVGFGGMNGIVHGISGVHMGLYVVTDWLGIIPFAVAAGFATLGLWQWVRRRKICRVKRFFWRMKQQKLSATGISLRSLSLYIPSSALW